MKLFGYDIQKAAGNTPDMNKLNELYYQFIGKGQVLQPYTGIKSAVEQGYMINEKIYSIVNRILSVNKGVQWQVYEVTDKQKFAKYNGMQRKELRLDIANELKEQSMEVVENDISKLLAKPNGHDSIDYLEEQLMGYYLLTGNSYLYKGVKRATKFGEPLELHVMPAHLVSIEFGNWMQPVAGYVFNNYIAGIIPADEVIHAKTFNPEWNSNGGQLYGMPPLRAAWKTLQSDNDALTAQLAAFQNSGAYGILSGQEGKNWTEAQARAIKEKWNDNKGAASFRDLVFSSEPVNWTQIGISPVDMAIISARQMTMRDLCNVYKVPVQLFNDNSASTYNNMREARKMMVMDAALPLKEVMKQMLNKAVAEPYSAAMGKTFYIDYDINAYTELQDDMDSLWNRANTSSFITGNEKRELTGFERIESEIMDEILLPAGVMPASSISGDLFDSDYESEYDEITTTAPVDESNIQGAALNGAQIASLLQIITSIVTGQVSMETGRALIEASFPLLSTTIVDRIIAGVEGFKPKPQA